MKPLRPMNELFNDPRVQGFIAKAIAMRPAVPDVHVNVFPERGGWAAVVDLNGLKVSVCHPDMPPAPTKEIAVKMVEAFMNFVLDGVENN